MNFCRPIDDDNLDGQEMSDGDYADDQSQDSYGTPRQHQAVEMTEERRRKLREVEVPKILFVNRICKQFWKTPSRIHTTSLFHYSTVIGCGFFSSAVVVLRRVPYSHLIGHLHDDITTSHNACFKNIST